MPDRLEFAYSGPRGADREDPAALALAPAAEARRLTVIKAIVLDALSSAHSRRSYDQALSRFLIWYAASGESSLSKASVQRYRTHLGSLGLAASTLNVHMSAIRKLAAEAADNGVLSPQMAAGIAKVRGAKRQGVRTGNWLSAEQAAVLVNAPDRAQAIGRRDRAMLAVLVGCGLRRSELVSLEIGQIQVRDGRWVIPDLAGKGNRLRTVPVPAWVMAILEEWVAGAGALGGPLFRPVNKGGRVLPGPLGEDAVWRVVRRYGASIGEPKLAPHDARRTCAKLCRASGGDIQQIQFLLGHASLQTTERYLGTQQNLARAVNDHLGAELERGTLG